MKENKVEYERMDVTLEGKTFIYCGRCELEQSSCTCKTQINKFEEWCIALKVPDPALDPKLRELILESRRLDNYQLPPSKEISNAIMSQYFTRVGLPVPSELEKK